VISGTGNPCAAAPVKGSPRPVHDPARTVALEVLRGVHEHDAFANLLLNSVLAREELDARDAAFATELTAGTLRMRGLYDAVLATLVGRRLSDLDPAVLDVLRLGTHQLLSMRVPSHAAVSTSVDLVRASVGPRPAGLVNAVLRKVAARDLDGWVAVVTPVDADRLDRLALRYSHPAVDRRRAGARAGQCCGRARARGSRRPLKQNAHRRRRPATETVQRTTSSRACWPPTTRWAR
jgi:16S rRNA (cytosine967-C5)-methyltransferase